MIIADKLTKKYDDFSAINEIDLTISEASTFGLVGTNGAGKSTFLKMVAGILKPDSGNILIDEKPVFEDPLVKQLFFFIPDEPYFFQNAGTDEVKKYYSIIYHDFDTARYDELIKAFDLPRDRKINTYSKGMKKLLSIAYGLSAKTKYLLCDETFDGLDPVMRQAVKSLFAEEISDRGLTPVITSHNLRELEDICDHVGLLHKGGVLLSRDLDDMKLNIHKVQCVLKDESDLEKISSLKILLKEKRGSLLTLTIRGSSEDIDKVFIPLDPIFYEIIPLSLEEIFISETEVKGYDIKKLIL